MEKLRDVWEAVCPKFVRESFSLLDVGCGFGSFLELVSNDVDYSGIDLVPEFIREARRRYPERRFLSGDVSELRGRKYDVVILAGVFSSVPNPEKTLHESVRRSKRYVIFDVSVTGRVRDGFEGLNSWTKTEVAQMCADLGFVVEEIEDSGKVWVVVTAMKK